MSPHRLTALFFLALSAAYGVAALGIEDLAGLAARDIGPGALPLGLACVGAGVSLRLFLRPPDGSPHIGGDWRRLWLTVACTMAYALLLPVLGFLVATSLFLAATTRLAGERRSAVNAAVAVGTALAAWLLLRGLLGVWLPEPLLALWGAGP